MDLPFTFHDFNTKIATKKEERKRKKLKKRKRSKRCNILDNKKEERKEKDLF